ncbi:hypothetical protein RHSIM_Rhsim05G0226600 [Rhododendron simsii]|uniref:Uncharacterized protein n=1 Tax=Rhododendron simsii TaxID=118357 RepID=A0A834LP15_RHOSS|nr:hypothetical protein RHSIM_Rhsim05G0226600 [Rhododendron simsii]
MASSGGNSNFSTQFSSSFSDLLREGQYQGERSGKIRGRNGVPDQIPRLKSLPPHSLPMISPPPVSPSSYLSIPSGLSPSWLLDSPAFLSTSNVRFNIPYCLFLARLSVGFLKSIELFHLACPNVPQTLLALPSPTTGTFSGLNFKEERTHSDFSFLPSQTRPTPSSLSSMFQSSANALPPVGF